jgi:hypothetical protein
MPNNEHLVAYFTAASNIWVTRFESRPRKSRGPRVNVFRRNLTIIEIVNTHVAQEHARLFWDLGVGPLEVKTFSIVDLEHEFGGIVPPDLDAEAMEDRGFFKLGRWNRLKDVWISRVDMHLIISGYMDFQMSANGFLYDTSKDIIVQLAFQTGNLWKTLELAKNWI